MSRRLERWVYGSTALLVFAGYGSLAAAEEIGQWVLALPSVFYALGPLGQRLDDAQPNYRRITSGVTFCFTVTVLVQYILIGLFATVISLTSFIILHKLAHRRGPRDYHQLILMAFFLLLCGCSRNPGAGAAAAISVFLLAGPAAYGTLHVWGELQKCESTLPPQRIGVGGILGWAGTAAAIAAGVMVVLFLATPRIEAGLLRTEEFEESVSGLSGDVDLSFSGSIRTDNSIAMRVRFPEEEGGRYEGPLRWRVRPLERYTGSRWEPGAAEDALWEEETRVTFFPFIKGVLSRTALGDGRKVMQEIQLEDRPKAGLPCLPWVLQVRCEDASLSWSSRGDFSVQPVGHNSGLRYIAWSEVRTFEPEELRACPGDYVGALGAASFERSTRHFLSQQSAALAAEVMAEADTVYDKAVAVERWLSEGDFTYSLQVPPYGGANPVDAFLIEGRQGHCELFATAMALMLRSQGIPTRVVTGYRGGEWIAGDKVFLVPRSMAHLWVEVYFLGKGWVTFDPSPPANRLGLIRSRWSRTWAYTSLRANLFWYRYVVGYRGGLSIDALRKADWRFWRGINRPRTSPSAQGTRGGVASLLLVGAGLLGLAAWVGWIWAQRRSPSGPDLTPGQRRARRLLRSLKRKAGKGNLFLPSATAAELGAALVGRDGADRGEVDRLIALYDAARFGKRSLSRKRFRILSRRIRRLG